MKINLEGLREKALDALRNFESAEGIELNADDCISVWAYLREGQDGVYRVHSAEVSTANRSPEGIDCEAGDLGNIEDWYEESWCYVFDCRENAWVTVSQYMSDHSEAA